MIERQRKVSMKYKIEKTEIPTAKSGRPSKYPFEKCTEHGHSFFLAGLTQEQVASIADHWSRKMGCYFSTRKVMEGGIKGIRIYRDDKKKRNPRMRQTVSADNGSTGAGQV